MRTTSNLTWRAALVAGTVSLIAAASLAAASSASAADGAPTDDSATPSVEAPILSMPGTIRVPDLSAAEDWDAVNALLQKVATMTPEAATAAVNAAVPGPIDGGLELDTIDDSVVYDGFVTAGDNRVHFVAVDAGTGAVLLDEFAGDPIEVWDPIVIGPDDTPTAK